MHVEDSIKVQRELGYQYEALVSNLSIISGFVLDAAARWLAFAQGRLRFQRTSTIESVVLPTANPGLGEGRRPREFPSVKRV